MLFGVWLQRRGSKSALERREALSRRAVEEELDGLGLEFSVVELEAQSEEEYDRELQKWCGRTTTDSYFGDGKLPR